MSDPTFHLAEDGRHAVWEHRCETSWGEVWNSTVLLPINAASGWVVVSTDPLTLTPSILCSGCGTNGFITEGRWVGV